MYYSPLGQNTKIHADKTLGDVITEAVKSKIITTVQKKKLKNNLKHFNKAENNNSEFDYKLCYNPKFPDKYFAISTIMKFEGNSLSDAEYGVYAFDKEGNETTFDRDNTGGAFFRDMYILTEI